MDFTQDELKMVRWLRGQHANWHSTRVIILICSSLTLAVGIYDLWRGGNPWHFAFLLGGGLFGLSYSLGSWDGRPEISLLLKLVEEHLPDKRA